MDQTSSMEQTSGMHPTSRMLSVAALSATVGALAGGGGMFWRNNASMKLLARQIEQISGQSAEAWRHASSMLDSLTDADKLLTEIENFYEKEDARQTPLSQELLKRVHEYNTAALARSCPMP